MASRVFRAFRQSKAENSMSMSMSLGDDDEDSAHEVEEKGMKAMVGKVINAGKMMNFLGRRKSTKSRKSAAAVKKAQLEEQSLQRAEFEVSMDRLNSSTKDGVSWFIEEIGMLPSSQNMKKELIDKLMDPTEGRSYQDSLPTYSRLRDTLLTDAWWTAARYYQEQVKDKQYMKELKEKAERDLVDLKAKTMQEVVMLRDRLRNLPPGTAVFLESRYVDPMEHLPVWVREVAESCVKEALKCMVADAVNGTRGDLYDAINALLDDMRNELSQLKAEYQQEAERVREKYEGTNEQLEITNKQLEKENLRLKKFVQKHSSQVKAICSDDSDLLQESNMDFKDEFVSSEFGEVQGASAEKRDKLARRKAARTDDNDAKAWSQLNRWSRHFSVSRNTKESLPGAADKRSPATTSPKSGTRRGAVPVVEAVVSAAGDLAPIGMADLEAVQENVNKVTGDDMVSETPKQPINKDEGVESVRTASAPEPAPEPAPSARSTQSQAPSPQSEDPGTGRAASKAALSQRQQSLGPAQGQQTEQQGGRARMRSSSPLTDSHAAPLPSNQSGTTRSSSHGPMSQSQPAKQGSHAKGSSTRAASHGPMPASQTAPSKQMTKPFSQSHSATQPKPLSASQASPRGRNVSAREDNDGASSDLHEAPSLPKQGLHEAATLAHQNFDEELESLSQSSSLRRVQTTPISHPQEQRSRNESRERSKAQPQAAPKAQPKLAPLQSQARPKAPSPKAQAQTQPQARPQVLPKLQTAESNTKSEVQSHLEEIRSAHHFFQEDEGEPLNQSAPSEVDLALALEVHENDESTEYWEENVEKSQSLFRVMRDMDLELDNGVLHEMIEACPQELRESKVVHLLKLSIGLLLKEIQCLRRLCSSMLSSVSGAPRSVDDRGQQIVTLYLDNFADLLNEENRLLLKCFLSVQEARVQLEDLQLDEIKDVPFDASPRGSDRGTKFHLDSKDKAHATKPASGHPSRHKDPCPPKLTSFDELISGKSQHVASGSSAPSPRNAKTAEGSSSAVGNPNLGFTTVSIAATNPPAPKSTTHGRQNTMPASAVHAPPILPMHSTKSELDQPAVAKVGTFIPNIKSSKRIVTGQTVGQPFAAEGHAPGHTKSPRPQAKAIRAKEDFAMCVTSSGVT